MLIRLLLVMSLLLNGWPVAVPHAHASMHGDAAVESGLTPTPPCHDLPGSESLTSDASDAAVGLPADCCDGAGCGCACMHSSAGIGPMPITVPAHKPAAATHGTGRIATLWHDTPAIRPPIA